MISIPELDFEQPSVRKGDITTVEGLIDAVINGLELLQPERRIADAEYAAKIDVFIVKLKRLKEVDTPFTIILDDPSGNSYIENPNAPSTDEAMIIVHYTRSKSQDIEVGCRAEDDDEALSERSDEEYEDDEEENQNTGSSDQMGAPRGNKKLNLKNEVLQFPTNCSSCNSPCQTNMKLVDIPFFKQVVIMATVCDACGNRDNEVKGGSGIEPKGKKMTLRLTSSLDLSRDILKSDTAAVRIPEIDLELVEGTLGGRFTTVEGLLVNIKEQLSIINPFLSGDSSQEDSRGKMKEFIKKLDKIIEGETLNVHLILDDPAGNSYMQNIHAPDIDPELSVEEYERSYDQNEQLGLNDMNTDNYS